MRIASFNVNSIKVRTPHVQRFLKEADIDVLVMQEIKCQTHDFPALEFAGYYAIAAGQKSYNGVAILSKKPMELILDALPGDDEDLQARYLEVDIEGVRIINIYAPNGNPIGTEKFPYKLGWMARLEARTKALLEAEVPFVILGDYNIIPEEDDANEPKAWVNDALFQPESRAIYRRFLNLGLTDALRMFDKSAGVYTFWDYQAGAWQRDHGIRIDHILMSPQMADKCIGCRVDKTPRGWEQPSDHTPIIGEFAL